MEYDVKKKEITIEKEFNILDRFTLRFVDVIKDLIQYVVVSGYVSIVLGRTRSSEDIDLLIEKMDFERFRTVFETLEKRGFECANTSDVKEAFDMLSEHAIRFFERGAPLPNMEFKMISQSEQQYALDNKITLVASGKPLFISPLELQIAYKLSLMAKGSIEEISSDKDFEDAKHIFELFKDELDYDELERWVRHYNVEEHYELLKQ